MMKCGADPGNTGAFVLLDDSLKVIDMVDMPVMSLGEHKQQVNAAELAKILKNWQDRFGKYTVYLELVHTMPGQGISSSGNFMMGFGVIQGICGALQIPLVLVRPNAWKRTAGLIGKPKDACRTLMQQLYPEQELGLKKHIGRADALAIARFSWMV
jgi:crossover junction endodeoxyribonuclease RuvC